MNEMDIKKIEVAEEYVKENKIQESDYLIFCNNFTLSRISLTVSL